MYQISNKVVASSGGGGSKKCPVGINCWEIQTVRIKYLYLI